MSRDGGGVFVEEVSALGRMMAIPGWGHSLSKGAQVGTSRALWNQPAGALVLVFVNKWDKVEGPLSSDGGLGWDLQGATAVS